MTNSKKTKVQLTAEMLPLDRVLIQLEELKSKYAQAEEDKNERSSPASEDSTSR